MTTNLEAERETIATRLTAAGVERVTLTRTEDPPFVFVGLPTGTGQSIGVGAWRCEYPVTAVHQPPGDQVANEWLLEQVELTLRTLGLAAFRPVSWGDDLWPAYVLVYPRDVPNPDC